MDTVNFNNVIFNPVGLKMNQKCSWKQLTLVASYLKCRFKYEPKIPMDTVNFNNAIFNPVGLNMNQKCPWIQLTLITPYLTR